MAHFSWFIKPLFLLLMMMVSAPMVMVDTRPARGRPHSELIAGNEFLKLFLERDELHSSELLSAGSAGSSRSGASQLEEDVVAAGPDKPAMMSRSTRARSLDYKARNGNKNTHSDSQNRNGNGDDEDSNRVKLVTSGSKIVFLEEYDDADNDAIVDAVALDIDLQKDKAARHIQSPQQKQQHQQQQQQQKQRHQHDKPKTTNGNSHSDEVKVVAVSVSSSSQRGVGSGGGGGGRGSASSKREKAMREHTSSTISSVADRRQHHRTTTSTARPGRNKSEPAPTTSATEAVPTTTASVPTTTTDFINRSHKSEFSIEEVEPMTSPKRGKARRADLFADVDSENSASTNIRNVLAAPLLAAASSKRATATVAYHGSGGRNATFPNQAYINQTRPPTAHTLAHTTTNTHASDVDANADAGDGHVDDDGDGDGDVDGHTSAGEDKLLPFQTVIYHDTKEGHGPQSRSISYSSLSQNVDDLHAWQHSGILAEARRNVSESLKPMPLRPSDPHATHTSEPAKFYSVPAKMYGVPSKFYSEPAKVYSEPSKVYGQAEKFYSEPSKVYSQPSKFYSEPAKVYSQPSKMYGEPAKTYWPHVSGGPAASTSSPAVSSTPPTAASTTSGPPANGASSRRPAIVSRIAFGEAQQQASTLPPTTQEHNQRQHHAHHTHTHNHHQVGAVAVAVSNGRANQPRRGFFNLDKLPYDLLNAPQQQQTTSSQHHLLGPDGPPAAVSYSSPMERSCLEMALSASSSYSAAQQQQQLQQQRQHSSLSDQHSNQNAKGLPNRDLVKCVAKYAQSAAGASSASAAGASFSTESSHIDDLYTPTPEQSYEIEESVSVMTHGRAHGPNGGLSATTTAAPATHTTSRSRIRFGGAGGRGAPYNTNANANVADFDGGGGTEDNDDQNNNNNNNSSDDYDDGGGGSGNKSGNNNNDDDDDAKVAYVVEGRNYRKYRVEEKTDDGFIVGEYGVVDHNDGNLRGVRYTADSTINPSLIQKALLTFLKLK